MPYGSRWIFPNSDQVMIGPEARERKERGEFMKFAIPRSVVFCKNDVSLPPGAYLGMAQGLGDFKLVEVEGSHEALFTDPAAVAKGLLEAIR